MLDNNMHDIGSLGRPAEALFSSRCLAHNAKTLKEKVGKAKIMAMVKADAYGHGLLTVAHHLQALNAGQLHDGPGDPVIDFLGVACLQEAVLLKKSGITIPIVIMQGVHTEQELIYAFQQRFHVVFHTWQHIVWATTIPHFSKPTRLWIKLETGMGRLGMLPDEMMKAFKVLSPFWHAEKPMILTHLACAENPDHPSTQKQIHLFNQVTQGLHVERSLCNSAGIFTLPHLHYDCVRPGIALYGVSPFTDQSQFALSLGLRPVMVMKTGIMSIKKRAKGQTIGYGCTYTCSHDMTIGIIAFGYADGYPLSTSHGYVALKGIHCPIIGRISMDMIAIDLTELTQREQTIGLGESVELWGCTIPLEAIAQKTCSHPWEILTGVHHRVRRKWVD